MFELVSGAIGAGLAIHFFTFPERYYFDPLVSLLVAALILRGAIPLGISLNNFKKMI
jgi:Co/Zn/Cd efflux system component